MGATLVKIALGAEWADLSRPARVLLTHMAVTALDTGERPRLYYAGHDSLAEALFGGVTEGRLRVVRRYVQELIDAGAIELVKKPSPRSNAHYSLSLQRRSKTDLRSGSNDGLTADQIGPTFQQSPTGNGGPNRSSEGRTKPVLNGGPNRSGTADQIGPTEEPVGTTKEPSAGRPADAVSTLVTSSSEVQISPYLGESPGFDGLEIGKNEKQDRKRLEEPRCKNCGVAETRHHQWTTDTGDSHPFTVATPASPRPPHPKHQKTPRRKRR
jgi:hypothetical protein